MAGTFLADGRDFSPINLSGYLFSGVKSFENKEVFPKITIKSRNSYPLCLDYRIIALIDGMRFAAGEKLRRDYTLAQLTPRMGVDLSAPVVSGGARSSGADTVSDIAVAARQRFTRALAAVGPGLGDLALEVCCDLKTLESAESQRGWSRGAAKVVLMLALDRLAAHYGLTVTAPPRGAIRAWTAPRSEPV
jgi:hypothetical protein